MRCARHDLACGPDGRCVLCARAQQAPGEAQAPEGRQVVAVVALVAVVAVGGFVAARLRLDALTRSLAAGPALDSESGAGRGWRDSARSLHIVVYTTSWCGVCRKAKAWLSAEGIPFDERDVEASPRDAAAMRALNARGTVPTFEVSGETMIGFSEPGFIDLVRRAAR